MQELAGIEERMAGFLADRGVDKPDGRPLYAYRARQGELEEFEGMLTEALHGHTRYQTVWNPAACGAFCLWAAEWWRRNHVGGPWKWEHLLECLEAGTLSPGSHDYEVLTNLVERGLTEWWGVELIRTNVGRGFLLTLGCQGGLPLKLVREGQGQGRIRRFFRALLQELNLPGNEMTDPSELARRVSDTLPKSLRQEVVYRLGGRLASEIRSLQSQIGDSTGPGWNPLHELERKVPGWRDDLPLRLDDEIAEVLLRNLLSDASDVARRQSERFKFSRSLRRVGDSWLLEGIAEVPRRLGMDALANMFGIADSQSPAQFQIQLRSDSGLSRPVAIGGRRPGGDGDASVYALEPRGAARDRLLGPEVAKGLRLHLSAPGLTVPPRAYDLAGGGALSDLPWVFGWEEGDTDGAHFAYIGEGSISARDSRVLIAVPHGSELTVETGGELTELGAVDALGRQVFGASGQVQVVMDGDVSLVLTDQEDAPPPPEYLLMGSEIGLDRGVTPLFRSVRLSVRDHRGVLKEVPAHELEWKPALVGSAWRRFDSSSVGEGQLRHRINGRARCVRHVRILPASASIRLEPDPSADGRGSLHFSGFGPLLGVAFHLESPLDCDQGMRFPRHDLAIMDLATDDIVETVTVRVDWAGGDRVSLQLPFPARWMAFISPDGRLLRGDDRVAVTRLSGVRAAALCPEYDAKPILIVSYQGIDRPAGRSDGYADLRALPRASGTESYHELELGRTTLEQWVQNRLAASTDPDATIRMWIEDANHPNHRSAVVTLGRFDVNLDVDVDALELRANEFSGAPISGDLAERLQVRACHIWMERPEEDLLESSEDLPGTWRLPAPLGLEMEEILLLGFETDLVRARPFLWQPSPSASGVDLLDGQNRAVATEISVDPVAPEWTKIEYALGYAGRVPLSFFPLLRALSHEAQGLALLAFIFPEVRLGQEWDAMEDLGFTWQGLPLDAWVTAFGCMVELVEDGRLPQEHLHGALTEIRGRLPAIGEALDRERRKLSLEDGEDSIQGFIAQDRLDGSRRAVSQSWNRGRSLVAGSLRWCPFPTSFAESAAWMVRESELGGRAELLVYTGYSARDPKWLIVNAPVLLAKTVIYGPWLRGTEALTFRVVRERDPEWFDSTFDSALRALLTIHWRRQNDDT